jgi:hypothetical protein
MKIQDMFSSSHALEILIEMTSNENGSTDKNDRVEIVNM